MTRHDSLQRGRPRRRLVQVAGCALVLGLVAVLGDFGPYARRAGPVLVKFGPDHGIHLADVLLAALVVAAVGGAPVLKRVRLRSRS